MARGARRQHWLGRMEDRTHKRERVRSPVLLLVWGREG